MLHFGSSVAKRMTKPAHGFHFRKKNSTQIGSKVWNYTMARLYWYYLPVELQEEVLLRVHWHDLCCCRAVCKAWNHMITQPRFATLHAATPRPESCVITSTRKDMPVSEINPAPVTNENDQWQLLDIVANRMFSIPDTFIRKGLLRGAGEINIYRYTIAASGGLIYALYKAENDWICPPFHVVCNPATKSFHQIPALPGGYYLDPVAMVVDVVKSTVRFRIVHPRLFWSGRLMAGSAPGEVHLYDSQDMVWRKLCDAPSDAHLHCSCVVLDGIFYVVCQDKRNRRHELYSCDVVTGEWRLIDVALPLPPRHPQVSMSCSQVVAASGRLYFVGYSGPGPAAGMVVTVTVWRITLSERPRLTLVAQLPNFMSSDGLCNCSIKFVAVATGCGKSIVVSSFHGNRVRWDVERGTWHRSLPSFLPKIDGAACQNCISFFAGTMDLEMRQMPLQLLGR